MLFTLSLNGPFAPALSYLLHKHPNELQSFSLSFGKAYVFYPEYAPDRTTVALFLEVDTVGLVRERKDKEFFGIEQYVNDRPYVASSFFSVALAQVFGSALSGRSKEKSELVGQELRWEAKLSVVCCKMGESLIRNLFEPLGYHVTLQPHLLDSAYPAWGFSSYFTVTLQVQSTLSQLLTHLYVLVPVLDNEKHYFTGEDEMEKLVRRGIGWLSTHPQKELIIRRYLKHDRSLAKQALTQFMDKQEDHLLQPMDAIIQTKNTREKQANLQEIRLNTTLSILKKHEVKRVLDLGCGEGDLLRILLNEESFTQMIGVDISHHILEIAARRLRLDQLPTKKRARIHLLQGSLTYRDKRLLQYDAATVIEVIEHLEPHRLYAFTEILFGYTRPKLVIVTTPNSEYNVNFENLEIGHFRHSDHRFEWTRGEFQSWGLGVYKKFGYQVQFLPIGPEDENLGSPTQMAVFQL